MQIQNDFQARRFAPVQAAIDVSQSVFFVHTRLGIIFNDGIIDREADVIHAPARDLLDVIGGDEGLEMIVIQLRGIATTTRPDSRPPGIRFLPSS